ncbi:MAG TPA: hypothetical protein VGM90_04355 [Kofleriaceae bacterium]
MSEAAQRFREAAIENVLGPDGRASRADRQAAYANEGVSPAARALVDKVTRNAWKVTDEDIAGAKAAGLSEDQVFELTVCAAMGQSTRQLDAAMAALDEAEKK